MSATVVHRNRLRGKAAERRGARNRRHFRLRNKISGTPTQPRLAVTRTLKHIRVQLIDDTRGHTIASASSLEPQLRGSEGTKSDLAVKVGVLLAQRAKEQGVTRVVFDRGGNRYHGRIAKLADAAREEGLEF